MLSVMANFLQGSNSGEKTCRKLFGPVDHEQLKNDFDAIMKSSEEEAKMRWNFDFANEVPLEGNYKWEKIEFPCPMGLPAEIIGGKRKQTLMTDFYSVKRRGSPDPTSSQNCS